MDYFSLAEMSIAEAEEEKRTEAEILAPYAFEIEETYREEGKRAGDRLVSSILRQEGFEPTSPEEQESTRQAIENERTGGTTAESEMEKENRVSAENAIRADRERMKAEFTIGQEVDFFDDNCNQRTGIIKSINDRIIIIESYGFKFEVDIDDVYEVE